MSSSIDIMNWHYSGAVEGLKICGYTHTNMCKVFSRYRFCFFTWQNPGVANAPLKYGFCKKLLWYKWTSDQLNIFFSSLFDWFCCARKKNQSKVRKKCSADQRFIRTDVTSYKIHILVPPPLLSIGRIRRCVNALLF